jgi:hypothetical protein
VGKARRELRPPRRREYANVERASNAFLFFAHKMTVPTVIAGQVMHIRTTVEQPFAVMTLPRPRSSLEVPPEICLCKH